MHCYKDCGEDKETAWTKTLILSFLEDETTLCMLYCFLIISTYSQCLVLHGRVSKHFAKAFIQFLFDLQFSETRGNLLTGSLSILCC